MTEEATPRLSKRPLMPWVILVVALAGGTITVLSEALSPVLILDVISLWPLLVPIVVLAIVVAIRRHSVGTLPLYLVSFLVLTVGVHLSEWEALPSSVADTSTGHDPAVESGRLEVSVPAGVLRVGDASPELAYQVKPIRRGGSLGAPSVLEAVDDGAMQLIVIPRDDGGWFKFAGWSIGLDPSVTWDLVVDGPDLEVDLRRIVAGTATVSGGGLVFLGEGPGTLTLDGSFRVVAGSGPIEVVGTATVPDDWQQTSTGFIRPVGGSGGWTITVEPGGIVDVSSGLDTPTG